MNSLSEERLSEVLRSANEIVIRAGAAILNAVAGSSASPEVGVKSSAGDLVTGLDKQLEREITAELLGIVPGSRTVGEEAGSSGNGSLAWIVDPIDGTTNVVHKMPHAAVSVALCEGYLPMLGLVRNPFVACSYFAIRGSGAFVSSDPTLAERTKLKMSSVNDLSRSLLSFGLPYDRSQSLRIFTAANKAFQASQDLRRRGSAALDLISVASGELEGHFELDLRIWDVAAAGLILEEAGGALSDWSGNRISWTSARNKLDIVASNGLVHDQILGAIG